MTDNIKTKRKIQKVFLIRPPLAIESFESKSLVFPLGLAYLGAALEKDYELRILDCLAEGFNDETRGARTITYGLKPEEIRNRIKSFSPDIVGISCLFSAQHLSSIRVAAIAKELDPGIITILGGAHPSSLPREVLKKDTVDFVIIGEAEESIIQLLDAIKKDGDFSFIDGLAYKRDSQIVVNPKTRYIQNLNEIPPPARHLLPMEAYFHTNRPHGMDTQYLRNTNMITSRGCPAQCIFCSIHTVFGRDYRARSAENVLREIEILKKGYGIKEVQFEDDNLTMDKIRAKEIFEAMIRKNLDVSWTAPNGVALWALDDELLELMKKSGCRHLALGIESGDQDVLNKIIKKPLKLDNVKPLIEKMNKLKIRTTSFFVLGFPSEKKEQIKNTLKFAASLPTDDLNIFFATPYPGTELCRIAKEKNLLNSNFNLDSLKVSNVNILLEDISVNELKKMVARAIVLFRFKKILSRPHIFIFIWLRRFLKEPPQALIKFARLLKESLFPLRE